MEFPIERHGNTLVIGVPPVLGVANRQELKQLVLDELERGESLFLIDFRNGAYIDSSGLGVLVTLRKRIREKGGELRLANLNNDLKTLFTATGIDRIFGRDELGQGGGDTV